MNNFYLKIKLDVDDTDLTKKVRKSVKKWLFGRLHKFHNIREFFKKEKGGYPSSPSWFFAFMANLWKKSSLEPHMKLASEVVEG
jgi:hypothetical protein